MWIIRTSRALWLLVNLIVHCSSNLRPGFSQLERGHRLDGSMINSSPRFSFLDCVTECLVTPRCASVNYFKGANLCELNYEEKQTSKSKYTESPGWVYSEKDHWPKELAGVCSNSNCSRNEKCVHKKYTVEKFFKCVISDCGIPVKTGLDLSKTKREDAIGVHSRIHASCSEGYFQFGSGRLICQSNGEWKYDIVCEKGWVQFGNHVYRIFTERKTWNNAKVHCESMVAYLVEIESLEENNWIYDNIVCDTCRLNKDQVWIGGSDQNIEGDFIWSKSGNKITFVHWSPTEPNNLGDEDCVEMSASTGKWNDRSCDSKIPFICEKNIN